MTNNKEPQSKPAPEKAVTLSDIQTELRAIGKQVDYVIARLGPGATGFGEGGEK